MKAPFPYFGGKSRAAALVWERLGDVDNYIEPFFGSGAVLLGRPAEHRRRVETVNDADGLLVNVWRALRSAPDAVAEAADWPVSEIDLHARHQRLLDAREGLTARLYADAEWCDPVLAGWWIWGACCWIGSGWCAGDGPWRIDEAGEWSDATRGIHRQIPHLDNAGRGIHRKALGPRGAALREWFGALSARLERARIAAGDWQRVTTESVTTRHGLTGVFLDPPYGQGALDYAVGGNACGSVAADAWAWALEHGDDPAYRIVVAGYDDGRVVPPRWAVVPWKAKGGYGGGRGNAADANRARERLWCSPGCLDPERQVALFRRAP